jgi:hypothetical protein
METDLALLTIRVIYTAIAFKTVGSKFRTTLVSISEIKLFSRKGERSARHFLCSQHVVSAAAASLKIRRLRGVHFDFSLLYKIADPLCAWLRGGRLL